MDHGLAAAAIGTSGSMSAGVADSGVAAWARVGALDSRMNPADAPRRRIDFWMVFRMPAPPALSEHEHPNRSAKHHDRRDGDRQPSQPRARLPLHELLVGGDQE